MITTAWAAPGTRTRRSRPARIRTLSSLLVMAAVTAAVSLFGWTVLPALIGWSPSVVLTGSMLPAIEPGDVVITSPVADHMLRPGYVIRFQDPSEPDRHLMHRIVRIDPDGTLVTKGDANQSEDSTPVSPAAVTGMARVRVPWVGLPVVWARQRQFAPLGLVSAVFLLAAVLATSSRRPALGDPVPERHHAPAQHRAPGRHRHRATGAHRRRADLTVR
jgi:signal peptidase